MRRTERGYTTVNSFILGMLMVVVLVAAVGAFAQTNGGGFLDGSSLGGQISDFIGGLVGGGQNTGGGGTSAGGGGGGPTPDCTGNSNDGGLGAYDPNDPNSAPVTGAPAYRKMTGTGVAESLDNGFGGGEVIGSGKPSPDAKGDWYLRTCGGAPAGYVWVPEGANPAAVAAPPAPPSPAEVRDRTPLPRPTFGVSPRFDGLTGLETWLWDANGGGSRTVNMTIRGYSVVATATPGRWVWDMGGGGRNPNPVLEAAHPGSEEEPAARYTYETPDDYTLTLTVTWAGTFTFSGNGVPAQTVDLGTTTQTSTRDFHVAEVRPVLTAA